MSQMRIEADQTDKQLVSLLTTLMETRRGCVYDGITAARFFNETWGIYADHHVYTSIMDQMTRYEKAVIVEPGGYTKFMIVP